MRMHVMEVKDIFYDGAMIRLSSLQHSATGITVSWSK